MTQQLKIIKEIIARAFSFYLQTSLCNLQGGQGETQTLQRKLLRNHSQCVPARGTEKTRCLQPSYRQLHGVKTNSMGPSFSNKKRHITRKSLERKSLRCHKSAPLSCSMVHAAFQSMHAAIGLFICTFAHMHGTPTHSLPVPWLGSLLLKSVKKLLLSQMDCVCFTSLVLMDRPPSTFHEQ